jgi:hypothetical protein
LYTNKIYKLKKLITLLALAFCLDANAQTCQGPPIFYENFNSGIPSSWTIFNYDTCTLLFNMPVRGYTGAWQTYEHYDRRCAADADHFVHTCASNDYLITPAITLGASPVCLSWLGSTLYTAYTETYNVLISTTIPDTIGFKANPPLAVVSNDVPTWTAHSVDLSAYAGQTVYLAFWNYTYDQFAIYIDDIRVSQPVSLDVSVTSANFPDVILPSSQVVSGQLLNGGLSTITSFSLSWQVNGGTVNTMPISSVSIAPSSYYNFTHTINWIPTANGTYTMKIWASNLNGASDMYLANDTLTQIIFVNTIPRKSLIETFSQASCPPCNSFNSSTDIIVQPDIRSAKVSSIKYHTIWPGVDPMNVYDQADVAQRVLYYGIGSDPSLLIDGNILLGNCGAYVGSAICLQQENIDSALAYPSIFTINVAEIKTASVFNSTVTLTAKTDIPYSSFSLYTVIIEDTVTYSSPPGTNGETRFCQVSRKMLPDSIGYPLGAMTNNQIMTFTYTYSPDTSMSKMSELHMVAFVSDDATRHVYQSENTSLGVTTDIHSIKKEAGITIYPNPNNGTFTIETNGQTKQTIQVYDINGKIVFSQSITGKTAIDATSLSEGVYNINITNSASVMNKRLVIVR